MESSDHRDAPLSHGDLATSADPAPATRRKERILEADAILFAVPEYNYSFPGVLKNAIDWATRPYGTSAWVNKPNSCTSRATWTPLASSNR